MELIQSFDSLTEVVNSYSTCQKRKIWACWKQLNILKQMLNFHRRKTSIIYCKLLLIGDTADNCYTSRWQVIISSWKMNVGNHCVLFSKCTAELSSKAEFSPCSKVIALPFDLSFTDGWTIKWLSSYCDNSCLLYFVSIIKSQSNLQWKSVLLLLLPRKSRSKVTCPAYQGWIRKGQESA